MTDQVAQKDQREQDCVTHALLLYCACNLFTLDLVAARHYLPTPHRGARLTRPDPGRVPGAAHGCRVYPGHVLHGAVAQPPTP